ncbi:MAG: hypothetical protein AAF928_19635 [Myxococcota bacterium]
MVVAGAWGLAVVLGEAREGAQAQVVPTPDPCGEEGPWRVALGAGLGAGLGAAGALGVSGGLVATDTRDFSFRTGALAGVGASSALALLYGLYDGFTGCNMAGDTIAFSVPIVTTLVGSLLPLAIWGASDTRDGPLDQARGAWRVRSSLLDVAF